MVFRCEREIVNVALLSARLGFIQQSSSDSTSKEQIFLAAEAGLFWYHILSKRTFIYRWAKERGNTSILRKRPTKAFFTLALSSSASFQRVVQAVMYAVDGLVVYLDDMYVMAPITKSTCRNFPQPSIQQLVVHRLLNGWLPHPYPSEQRD